MSSKQAGINKSCRQNLAHVKLALYQRKGCGLASKFSFNKHEEFPSVVELEILAIFI